MSPLFTHSGTSANAAFYNTEGPFWAEVTRDDLDREVPAFHVSVHKVGDGEVLSFVYEPELDPGSGPLSENVVSRIIREQLAPAVNRG